MTDDTTTEPTGISRRSLIKKSAVVGGAAMWATPVVQSITNKAFAQAGSPGAEISFFTLVLQNAAGDIYWAKFEGSDNYATCEGTNSGECSDELVPATESGCPPAGAITSITNLADGDVRVGIGEGWTLIDLVVKDGQVPCQGPGEGGQPTVPVVGGANVVIVLQDPFD